jgi:AraC-like DNA-binding protein
MIFVFSVASSFSHAFKKEFGCTLSQANIWSSDGLAAELAGFAVEAMPSRREAMPSGRDMHFVACFGDLRRDS